MSATIEVVRGMRDVLPPEQRLLAAVCAGLETSLAGYGYEPIDLPIVEQRDLYARKLGEDLVGKVYEFGFGGRNLALRPEWTASVLRAYVDQLQDQPLPLRLSYSGPVLRYERPQRHTYRQFTQVGVELIGGPAPRADAEMIALACAGLDAVGVERYRVVIGQIGLVRRLLAGLGLAERTQGLLIWSLERLRSQGAEAVRSRLSEADEELPFDPALLSGLDDEQAGALLLRLLPALGVDLAFGTRPPAAIIARLVRKLRRAEQQPRLEHAFELLGRLSRMRGAPAEVLPQVEALLAEEGIAANTLDELRALLALLEAHNLPPGRVAIDVAMGRGLHYYTGTIFEIYGDDDLQLCGGGRYDDLVTALGGRQATPAVGFAYGLERVAAAVTRHPDGPRPPREVLVAAVSDADYPYALEVARRLRARGFIVAVDVRGRTVAGNLRDAARRETAYVAIVGAEERHEGCLVWRTMATREEQRIRLDELPICGSSER